MPRTLRAISRMALVAALRLKADLARTGFLPARLMAYTCPG